MDYTFGRLVISKAGHDKGALYIIIDADADFVYLCDGSVRTLDKLKKKNKKHIQLTGFIAERLIDKKEKIIDEDVKRTIKLSKEHFHLA